MRHRENQRHALVDRGDDLYETPEVATLALLDQEWVPHRVWEPAAGRGAIARVLRAAGHDVVATDLVDYGEPDASGGVDFLKLCQAPTGVDIVITNPPFKEANAFVLKALHLCPRVIMLLRLGFLAGSKRTPILDGGLLARVHVFRNRLPMMHRDGWDGPKTSSNTEFAWFVWERSHFGPALINRISWKSPE